VPRAGLEHENLAVDLGREATDPIEERLGRRTVVADDEVARLGAVAGRVRDHHDLERAALVPSLPDRCLGQRRGNILVLVPATNDLGVHTLAEIAADRTLEDRVVDLEAARVGLEDVLAGPHRSDSAPRLVDDHFARDAEDIGQEVGAEGKHAGE